MPDTGAPYFIPYVEPTDLVRDYPAADEASADAIADALGDLQTEVDGAGGLVAVKSAIFTGTQAESVASGGNFSVTNLSITHEVADAANRLIISAFLGNASNSDGFASIGIAIHDGTELIAIGNADATRTRLTAGAYPTSTAANFVSSMPSVTFLHTPGAGSKTYTVRAVAFGAGTAQINRTQADGNSPGRPRSVSSLLIQEVKV